MNNPYKKALKRKKFEGLTIHIVPTEGPGMSMDPKHVDLKEERGEIPGLEKKKSTEDKEDT